MQLHSSAKTLHRARPSTVGLANAFPTPVRGVRASPVAAISRHTLPLTFRGPKPCAASTEVLALDTLFENVKTHTSEGQGTKTSTMRIHYSRPDKNYQNWGLHVWGDALEPTDWERPLKPAGLNQEGVWFDVPLREGARFLGIQVHAGETKSARAELQVADMGEKSEIWLEGDEVPNVLGAVVADPFRDAAPGQLSGMQLPGGALSKNAAIWVNGNTIVWRQPIQDLNGPRKFYLHANSQGELWMNGDGVQGGEIVFELQAMSAILPPDLARKYPYLTGCSALRLPPSALDMVTPLLRGQLAVSVRDHQDKVVDATGVQIQGALDAHFAYDGPLGCWRDPQTQKIMVSVWAPTARSMELLHYPTARGGEETVLPMTYGALGAGVWSAELPDDAMFTYYKYKINVWHPLTSQFETSYAADPYSRSLAANAERTQVVILDELLNDPRVTPEGWTTQPMPAMTRWTDISLYELSVRDFSSQDKTVKPEVRGKFLAFVPEEAALSPGGTTAGLAHLASLREAGLNHLHLLPFYDFGNVPERPEDQARIEDDLSKYAPDGQEQQRAVLATADRDAFNWGYDPVLFGVGDGSYATDPDGLPRILELRKMVMSLHKQGWRVVMDLVYNHLLCGGPHQNHSVLDKVVPGYYVRKHEDGEYCTATFGNNTANEMYMCERLIIDDMVHWAVNYKIDGWRWDIMGHFLVSTMEKIRARLDTLTIEKDGVDGKAQYMYGEAWEFAEVLNNMRGVNCGQKNLAGTKLGSFNDRMRDGAMGGGPWSPWDFQGFVTGLALAPSTCRGQGDIKEQFEMLGLLKDGIQYALAGNLRQYALPSHTGKVVKGEEITAYGLPLGYGRHPIEHISFIGCHDHLTMFDIITEKASITVLAEERVRMQVMSFALILMSQGIPFLHAGDDILRSKSLDKDSYNSGDWFNGVDWTCETHKLGVGLPVHTKNGTSWHYKRPLLTNPMIKPTKSMMKNTHEIVRQLLKIRYSSPLFRLPSAEAICNQVFFHNTGPKSIPGVIVMELVSAGPEAKDLPFGDYTGCDVPAVYDSQYERIVVVFNAAPLEKELPYPEKALNLRLHPLQNAPDAPDARARTSVADNSARQFIVPARTAAVFVQPR